MKFILMSGILSVCTFFGACGWQSKTVAADASQPAISAVKNESAKRKPPVLVELFTSEGCSDCPAADRVLARLEKEQPNEDAEIITLALHVDYWDRLGWKDRFASHSYSERQNEYEGVFKLDSIYTPQMVVDGQKEFVGSNFVGAQSNISEAAKNQKAFIALSLAETAKRQNINVKISELPPHENSSVWLATAEDDLQTEVQRGENRGKILPHSSVVRELKLVGEISSTDKVFETNAVLQNQPDWNRKNLKFVVFIQGKETKKIYGAGSKPAV